MSASPAPKPAEPDTSTPAASLADGSGAMFDGIAQRYDVLNRIMSLGLDRWWRRSLVRALALQPGDSVLDVATGTGDVALAILRRVPRSTVTGLDPSREMLALGDQKGVHLGMGDRLQMVHGDAQALPFPDNTFTAASIAFGIRNIPDRRLALEEMARVVCPGGRVVVLELTEPNHGLLGWAARLYVRRVIPWLGARLSSASEYDYLQASIQAFPSAPEFAAVLQQAGLIGVIYEPLTFGAATLFVGRKPTATDATRQPT